MEGTCAGWVEGTGEVDRGDEDGKTMDGMPPNAQFLGLAIERPPGLLEVALPPP